MSRDVLLAQANTRRLWRATIAGATFRGMTTHAIVLRGGTYRIETTSASGKRWLLAKVYPTEEAATARLRALHAMAEADQQMKRANAAAVQPRAD